ncbi:MAG: cyclic nucleotide-binding domain-containing protein [Sandaracinaceae bacterium]
MTSTLGPPISVAILRDIGLFGGLDEATLELLVQELPTVQVGVAEKVVEEGDPAREMFVVVAGELEVLKQSQHGSDIRLGLLGPGDWFGEMALVDVQPRSATVRALAPSVLLRFSAEHVDRLLYRRDLKAYALLVMNIARELSRRLRVADGILSQFVGTVAEQYVRRSEPPDDD